MSTADIIAFAGLIVSVISGVISVFAIIVSDRASARANQLTEKANFFSEKANLLNDKANLLSDKANQLTDKANSISVEIAKRDKMIDLWTAWQGVNDFDLSDETKTVWVDVIKAANALELTASFWNHDALEKEILFQSYWKDYRTLCDKIKGSQLSLPHGRGPVRDLITAEIKRAYTEMETRELAAVKQTKYP